MARTASLLPAGNSSPQPRLTGCRLSVWAVVPPSISRGRARLPGWRKAADWRGKLKGQMRQVSKVCQGGGAKKEERVEAAGRDYLKASYAFEAKVFESLMALREQALSAWELSQESALDYFHSEVVRHIDLVERRLLRGETIPHAEKVFSLFEPHTEWIAKGKLRPAVELGHRLLVATDQHGLMVDYQVLEGTSEVDALVPLADRLLGRFGADQVASLSTDQGFSRAEDRELLALYIPQVVVPKRGKLGAADQARESQRQFRAFCRFQHFVLDLQVLRGAFQVVFASAQLAHCVVSRAHDLADFVSRNDFFRDDFCRAVAGLRGGVGVEHYADRPVDIAWQDHRLQK